MYLKRHPTHQQWTSTAGVWDSISALQQLAPTAKGQSNNQDMGKLKAMSNLARMQGTYAAVAASNKRAVAPSNKRARVTRQSVQKQVLAYILVLSATYVHVSQQHTLCLQLNAHARPRARTM